MLARMDTHPAGAGRPTAPDPEAPRLPSASRTRPAERPFVAGPGRADGPS